MDGPHLMEHLKDTNVSTIIAGKVKMQDGKILGDPEGTPLKFDV